TKREIDRQCSTRAGSRVSATSVCERGLKSIHGACVHYALVIFDPYSLGSQPESIVGELQRLRGGLVTAGMVNGHVLILRNPFHNIHHEICNSINVPTVQPGFRSPSRFAACCSGT